ncbi:hypothetical protein [Rhizobium sp. P28RR-XV]|uniref:hypothetical protein n=1 Tax=Rhizobium sp. P28RR-XV TaxID=2726737 RepID=UPI0014563C61|nr:hypothetical protein [Rhizobium sp. P28RR-XV]NLR85354.1 hypothetical protein [Rhizobium sp. P28RR-XV]
MIMKYAHQREIPLDSEALDVCQRAFDATLIKLDITREHQESEVIAAFVIKLYQQGVHEEEKLFQLAMAASASLDV